MNRIAVPEQYSTCWEKAFWRSFQPDVLKFTPEYEQREPRILPIPGAKNARQASQNAGALGWRLTEEEHARISQAEVASR